MSNWKSILDFTMIDPVEIELPDEEKEKIYQALNSWMEKRMGKLILETTKQWPEPTTLQTVHACGCSGLYHKCNMV